VSEDRITKEQFGHWKQHPVTQEFFREIFKERERIKEGLVLGQTLDTSDADSTAANLWLLIGHARGLDFVLNTEFGDAEGTDEEG
jgi:hypothetical protein